MATVNAKPRSVDFLPEIFQTPANRQFLSATLDQLIQEPSVVATQGYVGRKVGPGVNPADQYIIEPTKSRNDYQLEPSVVRLNPDTLKVEDTITYPGLVDAIGVQGGITDRQDRLFTSEYYAFDPFVDYDKMVNYSQYFWLPLGPQPVTVSATGVQSTQTYDVTRANGVYTFSGTSGFDPQISLVRGGTYTFNIAQNQTADITFRVQNTGTSSWFINYQSNPTLTLVRGNTYSFDLSLDLPLSFYIKTDETFGTANQYTNGVVNNGASDGTITFTVPQDAPDTLYYVNDTQFNLRGIINIVDGTPSTGPGFWIQSIPGVTGTLPTTPNISSRDVLGVTNNGTDLGQVTFTVPLADAQSFYYDLTSIPDVDLISETIPYSTLNGMTVVDFLATYPNGIDNITNLDGLTVIFLEDTVSPVYNVYSIKYNTGVIDVTLFRTVNLLEKFNILFGTKWASTTWYKNAQAVWEQQPLLTAALNTLYYQDGVDPNIFGQFNIIEQSDTSILYVDQILGSKTYTAPNGVVFTNGLKVTFLGNTYPTSYENNTYYVEGVGTAIQLLLVSNFITPENYTYSGTIPYDTTPYDTTPFDGAVNQPTVPDYLTINRAAPDLDPWSRSNRWFHIDVIYATAAYNNIAPIVDNAYRAKRPILEFQPGLKLIDFGTQGLPPTSLIDFTQTDALSNVDGQPSYTVDGVALVEGQTVIFAADTEVAVRNQVYTVTFITPAPDLSFTQPVIYLVPTSYSPVLYDQTTVITQGETHQGTSYKFDGVNWIETQQKTKVNQAPLFDVFDKDGISFSNKVAYPSSTFTGCKLFSYLENPDNTVDTVLGIPLDYFYISSIGDIQFNNNLYSDTFLYVPKTSGITVNVSDGFVYQYADRTTYLPEIGWQTAITKSISRQQFRFVYDGNPLQLDIAVATSNIVPAVQLYVNAEFVQPQYYTVQVTDVNTTIITLTNTYSTGDVIEVDVISDQVSPTAFYTVPVNLENNPLNGNSPTFTLGNIRNHYKTIGENLLDLQGPIIGANNSRDLGNLVPYGDQILQQSSPLTMAGYFMRSQDFDVFAALSYNSREYIKYKDKILNAVVNFDYDIADLPVSQILDQAITNTTLGKTKQSPFYWSDMLPTGTNFTSTTVTVTPITTNVFNTTQQYDFTSSNYLGLLVYVNDVLLERDYEYTVDTNAKFITITVPLSVGDVVVINEYPDTAGNYCPSTPSKMGLYPVWKPEIYFDTTYVDPTYVIRGHDGSTTIAFGDIRDEVLLEFEKRIYDNIKMDGNPVPLTTAEITRGFWNVNDPTGTEQPYITNNYTVSEINNILGEDFLSWVGWNKVDFNSQYYDPQDPWTYNYSQAGNKITEQPLPGAWRGIYELFYGTLQPNLTPWESLGFSQMPVWWTSRYGPAPYTSGNLVLWDDLEAGYIADPIAPYIDPNFARPGLTKIIPAGTQGELLNPLESVVGAYDPIGFKKSWIVGDDGPVEASWRASSSYPFAVMRLLAVTRPAEFFSLFADRDLYKYNDALEQYVYNGRYRLNANNIQVYGNGVSKASFINWIVDYNRQIGVDSTTLLTNDLKNLDVRLAWRMASFVDKSFMNIFLERSAPGSTNPTLQLSNDAYDLFLYKNQPFNQLDYSGLIIEIVENGFAVYGYDNIQPFFNIYASNSSGTTEIVSAGGVTVQVPNQYTQDVVQIPYGYIFKNTTVIVDFILSYGKYLESQGISFLDVENGYTLNWNQMAQEFLYFSGQGWGQNTIINLNPSARTLRASYAYAVVDTIESVTPENMLLDQNRNVLNTRDLIIQRYGNSLVLSSSTNQTISFLRLKYTSYEDIVVFKNVTPFNDLIYDPITGLRQLRMGVQATVTAEWDGTLNPQGFILNQADVQEWKSYRRYTKGDIVKYKNQYWQAQNLVQPKEKFDYNDWYKSNWDRIEQGLLPNIATKADQLADSYNIHYENIATDQNLFAYGLIGFRPRTYMTDLNLDIVSQVNVYQQFIKSKGTILSAELFTQANLKNESGQYDIYENWAVLAGTYGANANRSFFELRLNEALLQSNPATVQVINPTQPSNADQTILLNNISSESYKLTSTDILPTKYLTSNETSLPSAGYVSLDDVDITIFSLDDPSNIAADINNVGIGTIVWVAKVNTYDWGIYQCGLVPPQMTTLTDNLNGTSVATFNDYHNLSTGDLIIIKYFDAAVNGVYRVLSTPTPTTVTIAYTFVNTNQTSISSTGLAFYLQSMRVKQASDVASLPYINNLTTGSFSSTVWIDNNGSGHWEVIRKQNPFTTGPTLDSTQSIFRMGNSVAQTYDKTLAFVGAPGINTDIGAVYPYVRNPFTVYDNYPPILMTAPGTVGFGTTLTAGTQSFIVSGAPQSYSGTGYVGVIYRVPNTNSFRFSQMLLPPDGVYSGALFGTSVEMSIDEQWLYVGAPGTNKVYAYGLITVDPATVTYFGDDSTTIFNFSNTIQVTSPATQVLVTVNGIPQTLGVEYTIGPLNVIFTTAPTLNDTVVISRLTESNFTGNGTTVNYNISALYTATTIESFSVTVNGVVQRPLIDYTFTGTTITFTTTPATNSEIVVFATSYYSYVDTITVSGLPNYAQFGASVATGTDGRTLIVGAPVDDSLVETRAGSAYIFNRSLYSYEITNTAQTTYAIPGTFTSPITVIYDGLTLKNSAQFLNGDYSVSGSNIVLNSNVTLVDGDILTIETNQFAQIQQFNSEADPADQSQYGYATALCPLSCSAYIGAPHSSTGVQSQNGSVERLVNQSKSYGIISSTVANPNLTGGKTLSINGFLATVPVFPQNTVTGFVNVINGLNIPNVTAVASPNLTFIGDGFTQNFSIGSAYSSQSSYNPIVFVNGVEQTYGSQYTYDNTTEQVIFISAPAYNTNIVVVTGLLTLTVTNSTAATPGDKLTVLPGFDDTAFTELGFEAFVYTQTITSPLSTDFAYFGSSIEVDPTSTHLVVGAPNGTAIEPVTFDGGATYFDELSTTFFSPSYNSGIVYTYDYLPSSNDSVTNPGQFAFGQQIFDPTTLDSNYGYGSAINYVGGILLIGSPGNPNVTQPTFDGFAQMFTNFNDTPVWQVIHEQQPVVDIYELDSVYSFNQITRSSQTYYDFFDPLQGKIIGVAARNIDYTGGVDPASYNIGPIHNNGDSWASKHIGEIWWDTARVRFIDPNQGDIVYASRRWANVFPGSNIDVYQWVESSTPPDSYTGLGTPLSVVSYTIESVLDKNNVFVTRYYFWVRGISTIATGAGKTLSTTAIATYIQNPRNSGIPYIAPLNSSTIALYNFAPYVSASDTLLHVGFDRKLTNANIHQQFQLIPEGRADAFLDANLYRKLLDSFSGADTQGQRVPDPLLPVTEQYGVQYRPRQTMFIDRFAALENYLGHANTVIAQYPITETRSFNLLNSEQPIPSSASGEWDYEVPTIEVLGYQNIYAVPLGYKYLVTSDSTQDGLWTIYTVIAGTVSGTRELYLSKVQNYYTPFYWDYIDWYLPGYNTATVPSATVPNRSSLETISLTKVPVGAVAKVTANAQGDWELYQRTGIDPKLGWTRVALQNGTIAFKDVLWDYAAGNLGFDGDVFDGQYFDQEPSIETRKIVEALNEEIYVDDLLIQRNQSLTLMFKYIFSENTAPSWLNKTSLIDVDHQVRSLLPYQTYIQDNQTFVLDYIQEVKPYHVVIRAFNLIYTGQDVYDGSMTDFDCPAYWNTSLEIPAFTSPILLPYTHTTGTQSINVNNSDTESTDQVWVENPWNEWYNNYLLGVTSVTVLDGGSGYTTPPTVIVTGTADTPATLTAVINSTGQVIGVVVDDPGFGYSETATITFFGGNGTGATAIAYMGNELVRSFRTTIKYDRNQYVSTITDWTSNVFYAIGTQVRYANSVWQATQNVQMVDFDTAYWEIVPAEQLGGVDRTQGYYVAGYNQPGLNLPLLIDGLDYPGVQVYGLDYNDTTTIVDADYESSYLDIYLGQRPTDINVDGGGYVDVRSAYNPEELVAGSTFDTLDFRVYSQSGGDSTGLDWGWPQGNQEYTFTGSGSRYSFAGLVPYPVQVLAYNSSTPQALYSGGLDYTIDWVAQEIIVYVGSINPGETLNVVAYGLGGGNQLYQNAYTGTEVLAGVVIPVETVYITDMAIFACDTAGYQTILTSSDYTVTVNSPTTSLITVTSGVSATDYVNVLALGDTELDNGSTLPLSWSTPLTEFISGTNGATTSFPISNPLIYTNPVALVVYVDGYRKQTAGCSEYYGDGTTVNFALPNRFGFSLSTITSSDVQVYSYGTLLTSGVDYTLSSGNTNVIFTTAPVDGTQILIAVTAGADCYVSGTNLVFATAPAAGTLIEVITWNDTRQQNIVPQVFVGPVVTDVVFVADATTGSPVLTNVDSFEGVQVGLVITSATSGVLVSASVVVSYNVSAQTITLNQNALLTVSSETFTINNIYEGYDSTPFDQGNSTGFPGSYDWSSGVPSSANDLFLSYEATDPSRLMVSLNGNPLTAGIDFSVNGNELILPNLLNTSDVVMVSQFTNTIVSTPAAFRIFQDMRGVQTVHNITLETTTATSPNVNRPTQDITDVVGDGVAVTVTLDSLPTTPYQVGDSVIIDNVTPSSYDGTFVINSIISNQITFASSVDDTYVSGGTITLDNPNVLPTDDIIHVVDASTLSQPDFNENIWGVLTINGERIMYRDIDYGTNTVSSLLRGTAGTATAEHTSGAVVYNMSRSTLAPIEDQNYIDSDTITATGSQTVFTTVAMTVDPSLIAAVEVYVGGIRLFGGYTVTATNPVRVVLATAPAAGVDVTILIRRGHWWVNPASSI